jgi:hypothetical protein
MGAQGTVVWRASRGNGATPGGCCGLLVAGTVVAVMQGLGVPVYPGGIAAVVLLVALGAGASWMLAQYDEHTAEFDARTVRLVSEHRERTVDHRDLRKVTVEHSGYTHQGYTETTLRLEFRDGPGASLTSDHAPHLAASLRGRLHRRVTVEEVHRPLEELTDG